MQAFTPAHEPVVHPGLAGSAYRGVVRRTTPPRTIEYRVFAEITLELAHADRPDAPFPARVDAIQRNRSLWWTLACDVAGENNPLPAELRASIISLALWVDRESSRALRQPVTLADLIAINRTIMAGLQPTTAEPR
jgi:flagellar protein FlaF